MSCEYENTLLRLSDAERQKMQLGVAALKVSEYTDDVDDFRRPYNSEKRMIAAIREFFDTVTGLAIASDVIPRSTKEALMSDSTFFSSITNLLEDIFEIIRRYKRLNPTSYYGEYGKLVMILQDVQRSPVQSALGIESNLIIPLKTIGKALEKINCSALLHDPDIKPKYLNKSGEEKINNLKMLVNRYAEEDVGKRCIIETCLRSIDDVRQLLISNIEPLIYLRRKVEVDFMKMNENDKFNIAVQCGKNGACFTHTHMQHCYYVAESLLLWEKVQQNIFAIWDAAEEDMLTDSRGRYQFCNTGQGFHRMCEAPKSYHIMSMCVREAERQMGGWVGIKVIHLGDRDVPNPLVFIDKYTLIPRIVQPIVHSIRALRAIFQEENEKIETESCTCTEENHNIQIGINNSVKCRSSPAEEKYPGLRNFLISRYGDYKELQMRILCDFFKHAFDGSGDDGGNCIDGRLTSAWNWCHQLTKKRFYDAFVLTGFNGFDEDTNVHTSAKSLL